MAEREGGREEEIAGGQGIAGDKKESTNIQARGWRGEEEKYGRNGEEFLQSPEFSHKHARRASRPPCHFSHSEGKRISVRLGMRRPTVTILAPSTLVRPSSGGDFFRLRVSAKGNSETEHPAI